MSSEETSLRMSSIQLSTSSASVKNWWKSTASVSRFFLASIRAIRSLHRPVTYRYTITV